MAGQQRGKFTIPMVCVQASIPEEIDKAVDKKAKRECLSKATYYRKWIIAGYKKDMKEF